MAKGVATLKMKAVRGDEKWVDERMAEREAARRVKDFKKADKIRKELAAKGIVLEDLPDGTTEWRRAG
jgi:cysteinyl-tRNA synthetase